MEDGHCLTGEQAPKFSELEQFLAKHPEYTVDRASVFSAAASSVTPVDDTLNEVNVHSNNRIMVFFELYEKLQGKIIP